MCALASRLRIRITSTLKQLDQMSSQMSVRAQRRLALAMGMLSVKPGPQIRAEDALCIVNALPPEEKQRLKELVDWAEEYERYEPD